MRVLQAYGGQCDCCGEKNHEFLAVDHIGGGGAQHALRLKQRLVITRGSLKSYPSNGKLFTWLAKNGMPAGFRLLCHNCNHSLGLRGYCPHKSQAVATLPDGQALLFDGAAFPVPVGVLTG